ncbi:uncharacterized protein LOC124798442 isoform X1 [Schistocerca piceifrons]|uniref:uncharacterized protein LOC124798442 isoform X1 n=1 Tax=Schistocerca piceifrons TaxID=274613 RepID=UPI001F5FCDEE|nr:uncharacterized protein LOC124798442 isoform X1 [Schistocerca piceifrons]
MFLIGSALFIVTELLLLQVSVIRCLSLCQEEGWSCEVEGKSVNLLYHCNEDIGWNAVFEESVLTVPDGTHSITITDCYDVMIPLSFSFHSDLNQRLPKLSINNVASLLLTAAPDTLSIPQNIILNNIHWLDCIKRNTFSGDWQSIAFSNVTIDRIDMYAFAELNVAVHIEWDNVNVNLLDTNAIANVFIEEGSFKIKNSVIETMEIMSFGIKASKVVIENSHIKDIRLHAFNVEAETFIMVNNSGFRSVMPGGFIISAHHIEISRNRFGYLMTRSLENIRSNLLSHSTNPIYIFKQNYIESADVGSLHCNVSSFTEHNGIIYISDNKFVCSCIHLSWITQIADSEPELAQFYKTLLENDKNNTCSIGLCSFPLSSLRKMINTEYQCVANITYDEICNLYAIFSISRSSSQQANYLAVLLLVIAEIIVTSQ